jgi:UDP-galactopyranose mutase
MEQYDFLIVGAGLFGSVFAREATDQRIQMSSHR